jgi:GNAT superfamily N-acetyltransferase
VSARVPTRSANASDTEPLLDLWVQLIDHHRRLSPELPGLRPTRASLLGEIERGLASAACRIFVAESEGRILGFLFAEADPPGKSEEGGVGRIHETFVLPGHRGVGVGTALVRAAVDWVRDRGASRMSVRVEESNPEARLFWLQLGFADRARVLERPLS